MKKKKVCLGYILTMRLMIKVIKASKGFTTDRRVTETSTTKIYRTREIRLFLNLISTTESQPTPLSFLSL